MSTHHAQLGHVEGKYINNKDNKKRGLLAPGTTGGGSSSSLMDEGVGDTEFLSELDGVTLFPEAGKKISRGGNPAM